MPLNAWLHDSADWHLELAAAPDASSPASSSAPDSSINALAPEDAAAALEQADA